MNENHRSVTAGNGVAPYIGGKRFLAPRIIERIEAMPHDLYAECFVGMGGVFLRRQKAARFEVINDKAQEVALLFRVIQEQHDAFLRALEWRLTSRAEFERQKAIDPATLDDVERAARFYYLQRCGFGGKVVGRTFGISTTRLMNFNIVKLAAELRRIHERLAGVMIECLDFADFLTLYDRTGALFYLDPPYWKNENDYGKGLFCRADFMRLADILRGLKGSFLLSINDTPEVRDTFAGFHFEEVGLKYVMGLGAGLQAAELIISNRPPSNVRGGQGNLL